MDDVHLRGRNFLKLLDFSHDEIFHLLDIATDLKIKSKKGVWPGELERKKIAYVSREASALTKVSFEVACADLGIELICVEPDAYGRGEKERVLETARVFNRLFDGIVYCGFRQEIVEELATASGLPAWNGFSKEFHPTQMLADLLTIQEHFGYLEGVKLTFLGDGKSRICNSLIAVCAKMGVHLTICTGEEYFPDLSWVESCSKRFGGTILLTTDPEEGTNGADVLYSDLGAYTEKAGEEEKKKRRDLFPYRVTQELMENAQEEAVFMHCLSPSPIPEEGTESLLCSREVLESGHSIVFDQAENRMHAIKALLYAALQDGEEEE